MGVENDKKEKDLRARACFIWSYVVLFSRMDVPIDLLSALFMVLSDSQYEM